MLHVVYVSHLERQHILQNIFTKSSLLGFERQRSFQSSIYYEFLINSKWSITSSESTSSISLETVSGTLFAPSRIERWTDWTWIEQKKAYNLSWTAFIFELNLLFSHTKSAIFRAYSNQLNSPYRTIYVRITGYS